MRKTKKKRRVTVQCEIAAMATSRTRSQAAAEARCKDDGERRWVQRWREKRVVEERVTPAMSSTICTTHTRTRPHTLHSGSRVWVSGVRGREGKERKGKGGKGKGG